MRILFSLIAFCICGAALADSVVATSTIRAQQMIAPGDVKLRNDDLVGGISEVEAVIGLEARVALYPGRPVQPGDVGPPAVVERNQLVVLVYDRGGLVIRTEARVLDRAGVGDLVKVMNMVSRATLFGRVLADGTISVSE